MRTGRPAKASTIYKVSIHDNGGRKYASTQPFTVDDDGKKHYTHKHWGIVDDDMRFHPNSTYFYALLYFMRNILIKLGVYVIFSLTLQKTTDMLLSFTLSNFRSFKAKKDIGFNSCDN